MLYNIKKTYNNHFLYNKHNTFLTELPKITQKSSDFKILNSPKEFNYVLLNTISQAHKHICLVTLYLENDPGGKKILDTILEVKKNRPTIKINIIVDWYRAQRTRFGESIKYTNIHWYNNIIQNNPNIELSIFGLPIHFSEILGVLHLKGFIIDDTILYSGANLNNEYLHINDKYRYDRYYFIKNAQLSAIMLNYIEKNLINSKVIHNLDYKKSFLKKNNKNNIRLFRKFLKRTTYTYQNNANFNECSIIPLVGLGKNSILNKTIYHLISSVKQNMILCTPYFNIPYSLNRVLYSLLQQGKTVEIIVGDKTANDFYTPYQEYKSFKLINVLPYLYEINLRLFIQKLQNYIDNKQLIVRIWKKDHHGYHIKGIWIDDEWNLLTGSNLNPRSLKLDLENALLIHDPCHELIHQKYQELTQIRVFTKIITHYTSLQNISEYPVKIKRLILRIRKIKFDKLINQLL
ncbi:phosphatidylserine synthase (CDP-diacylglycerol-serine O-phosphatidyltransferase) [Candidatus Blochmanniella floridana]|uniref:Phosphatidylserine synthase (CDP-diacylglycerol-serine O-phosphatidyltransferase) n=1 Tax=Blochmanniella floridana TaxID=203907 RepID=Q7VRQ0_BLOFL|nr:phosphatidylserine synthase (CDP-diacylglycerol-serine O-phosphatidyltransferase) [Candidatus Blochmannia floridanus]